MALLRCCGREALVHNGGEEEGEGCLHNLPNCDSQRKAEVITVLKDVLYVFISLGVVYLYSWMLFREDMGRNTRKWTAMETHDFLQSVAYHENKTLTQESEILGRWANYQARVFLGQFVPAPWPVGMFPKFLLGGMSAENASRHLRERQIVLFTLFSTSRHVHSHRSHHFSPFFGRQCRL